MNRNISYDRFIPFKAAMGLDYGRLAAEKEPSEKSKQSLSVSHEYRTQLAKVLGLNRSQMVFSNKKHQSRDYDHLHYYHFQPRRYISQTPERTLDAPDLVEDLYMNLLDWGSAGVLALALGDSVYLWDSASTSASLLFVVDSDKGPVTSLNWAPDGLSLAVGLCNGQVQLWDCAAKLRVRTFEGCHQLGVGSLAWKDDNFLTTGGMDGKVINNDVRIGPHAVASYRGHRKEVCGLKWSPSGRQLASAGCDTVVRIWDVSRPSSSLHSLREHTSAVKALAWCPFQTNLLATGGVGQQDGTIKFWNTLTGACLNSVDNGSPVFALLWSNKEKELLSSHGLSVTLWKYPSMVTLADFTAHQSNVLYMAQSPNDCTVATAAAGDDQTLKLWNVFGVPEVVKKPAPRPLSEPFPHVIRIR